MNEAQKARRAAIMARATDAVLTTSLKVLDMKPRLTREESMTRDWIVEEMARRGLATVKVTNVKP